jgi:hypothetical protein
MLIAIVAGVGGCASTHSATVPYEQTYLSARHNWSLRKRFPDADALLNAFDYGHATLYQTLLTRGPAAATPLEGAEFDFITKRLLVNPPGLPLDETAIGPAFATLAPEVLATFDWAHMLHRQLYDVWTQPGFTDQERDTASVRVIQYYLSRHDLALSTRPKSMALMEGQPYSLVFRTAAPKFNGLLWSYHWYQLALQDALLVAHTDAERRKGIDSVRRAFFAKLADAPAHMPATMPMSPEASPVLAARYPQAAIIFDNLHALHDVVSDILMSPTISRGDKRAALLAATAAYRDDSTSVISIEEWRMMAHGADHRRDHQ